ncbi:GcrA family cell cycle regulator [Phyllobacterium endophyticum]|jgi:GcrA cell cycle regulator|uniref:GcrA cell cycle regulator n=1 Tax=Phyllobacterium endophyticum TaxID=1149773 RepID=A0A2P7B0X6_9HYPH|nr:GcrA family cell cycle regulator [Phyllobacterium endophyticum]MBB3237594.1 GcrA cell cycle regulator [Phyllobacterium endophyticum]PSH60064.1 GcrA cell cycle regulator [Phyllobacterium endophyticum]TXR48377.1 GcrA cell cycle regulator [Phyllobacterium endophyticum]TYR42233.1 GcrA cell cycle regulator [Phyllobacterium endophyticum]
MNWTDERVEQLKKLWAEGLSASQIAAQLGGVSRNAVIGKVHRLKLSGRGKSTSTQTRSKKVNTTASGGHRSPGSLGHMSSRVVNRSVGATALQTEYSTDLVAHTVTKTVTDVVVPISRRLELVQLSERTCKWPVGDPLQPDFNFCGNDVGESGPYCTYHSRLAYQPASDRRRIR